MTDEGMLTNTLISEEKKIDDNYQSLAVPDLICK